QRPLRRCLRGCDPFASRWLMAGQGGYQAPADPAPVSGPGRLARRTDSGPAQPLRALPDARYGGAKAVLDQQRAAPLPQTAPPPTTPPARRAMFPDRSAELVPASEPTRRPDEPVTAGASLGPGPGPEALMPELSPTASYGSLVDLLRGLTASDTTG